LDFEVGGCEILPTFRVGNPTSKGVPPETSDLELGNSDFRVQLERTVCSKGVTCFLDTAGFQNALPSAEADNPIKGKDCVPRSRRIEKKNT